MSEENFKTIKQELIDYSTSLASYKTEAWSNFPGIDLYMDQVVTYLEKLLQTFSDGSESGKSITSSMVNNYVKEGYIKRPINKKYNKEHLITLYTMSMLKAILPIPLIANSLNKFENEAAYMEFYEQFIKLQDDAFNSSSNSLSKALEKIEEGNYEASLRLFALQLTSEANTKRMVAGKILDILNKDEAAKQSEKKK